MKTASLSYTFPFTLGSKVPENVYLDLTNMCNLKCTMCPQGHNKVINKGFIAKELFLKIVDDVASLMPQPRLAFHLIGEPFLHKDILEFVSRANQRGLYTFLHTNGTLLNEDKCQGIVESGLNQITFSFEGEDSDRYRQIRCGSNWETVVKNIQYLLKFSKGPEVIVEVLKFRGIDDSLDISKDFKDLFPGSRFHSYFASDWRGTLDNKHLKEKRNISKQRICKIPLCDMAVGWDGIVKACTIDYNSEYPLGDLKKNSIMDVWLGEKRKAFLNKISNKDYSLINVCQNCNAPYYAHEKERTWTN